MAVASGIREDTVWIGVMIECRGLPEHAQDRINELITEAVEIVNREAPEEP